MASLVIHAGYGGSDFVERIHNLRLRVQRFQPCLNRVVHYGLLLKEIDEKILSECKFIVITSE